MTNSFSFEQMMAGDLESAMVALDAEQNKLREFQREVAAARTTVRSNDYMLSATFDGRGELTELKFHSTKYRAMAPAELAHAIVTVLADGRAKALKNMAELNGAPTIPGVDFGELASGKADLDQVMQALLGPMFGQATEEKSTEG